MLLLDSRRLRRVTSEQGIDIDDVEYQDMVHGWVLLDRIVEARQATAELTGLLGGKR